MNQEESAKFSGYEASAEEIQKVIIEWANVMEAFQNRYDKLNQIINSLQAAVKRQPSTNRARLFELIELREHMSDVLMTLLFDMSKQKSGRSAQPSKPGQLHSHASLLAELNRKIDAKLTNVVVATTVAQA